MPQVSLLRPGIGTALALITRPVVKSSGVFAAKLPINPAAIAPSNRSPATGKMPHLDEYSDPGDRGATIQNARDRSAGNANMLGQLRGRMVSHELS